MVATIQKIILKTGYELPVVSFIEDLLEKKYHPKEDVELLQAVKCYNPELEVLYAYYSDGELVDIIKRELNCLETQLIVKKMFKGN